MLGWVPRFVFFLSLSHGGEEDKINYLLLLQVLHTWVSSYFNFFIIFTIFVSVLTECKKFHFLSTSVLWFYTITKGHDSLHRIFSASISKVRVSDLENHSKV